MKVGKQSSGMALGIGLASVPINATSWESHDPEQVTLLPGGLFSPLYKWGNNRTYFPGLLKAQVKSFFRAVLCTRHCQHRVL